MKTNKNQYRTTTAKRIAALAALVLAININTAADWRKLDDGLHLGKFQSPHYNSPNDTASMISILRIDTKKYDLVLMNASHPKQGELLTAREWGRKEGLAAVINAAMYQTDYKSSVSYMKTSGHVNNPRISKDKTILVFEPLQKNIPRARIVDIECDDFNQLKTMYGSAVQSIRMLSCAGKNVWAQSDKRWSIAAVGMDKTSNVLFIQCTAPHSVHEFNNVLRDLPISIDRAMYMEGGSPSQMYIGAPSDTIELIGEFSVGGKRIIAEPLPNVLGVRKR